MVLFSNWNRMAYLVKFKTVIKFLNRKQKVVFNGQTSSWVDVNAGVSQGFILGPLLFLIYIYIYIYIYHIWCVCMYVYVYIILLDEFKKDLHGIVTLISQR